MTDALLRLVSTVSRLKDVDLFRRIPADYLVPLARIATERTFLAGEALFAEGEAGDGLYLILEGEVVVLRAGAEVARLGAGECLGEMAVLDAGARSATAVGAAPGRALKLPASEFQDILAGHPEISRALLATLARRLRATMEREPATVSGVGFARVTARSGEGASAPEPAPAGDASPAAPALREGELLGGRYRVGARRSRDEASETFRGEDVERGTRVRLLALEAGLLAGDAESAALESRLEGARAFSHPLFARLLDVLPDVDGTCVLVEEEPRGESLRERLEEDGPLGAEEALQVLRDAAGALASAHAAGLVHGHLSSGRLFLSGAGGVTRLAAILDLGCLPLRLPADRIAGDLGEEPHEPSSTACLAPEQVRGEEARPASDVYALGALLLEMLTGRPPFLGATAAETALLRLRSEAPDAPEGLPDRVAGALRRALCRRPEDRFPDPGAFLAALGAAPAPRSRRRNLAWLAAGAILVAGLGALAGLRFGARGGPAPEAPRPAVALRPSVAVLGFTDASSAPVPWIRTALAEMLASELSAGSRLRLIPGEDVARARAELKLSDSTSLSLPTLSSVRSLLGSDFVVLGTCTSLGEAAARSVRCEARLQDARSAEVVTSASGEVPEDRLPELARRLGARLRYELRVGDVPLRLADAVEARVPSSPEARRLYAEGLERLRGLDTLAARDLLARAVTADPEHALARSALAEAQSALGHDGEARESARRAWELALELPREDRLVVEARYHELSGDRGKALALYERLAAFAPDSPDYGLRLAGVKTAAGRGKDALETLANLRLTVPVAAGDPRVQLAEAEARQSLSDFAGQLAAATRAESEALSRNATFLLAPARLQKAAALRRLGKRPDALVAAEGSRQAFLKAGDRAGAARALCAVAQLKGELGSLEEALRLYAEALTSFREIGNERGIAEARLGAGTALWHKGDLPGARKSFRDALSLARQTESLSLAGRALNALGNVAENAVGSRTAYEEALQLGRRTGDKGLQSTVLNNLAVLLEEAGDLRGARGSYEGAVAIKREIGDLAGLPAPLTNIASLALRMGDLAGADAAGEESLAITRKGGSQRSLGFALTARGNRRLAAGDLAGARTSYQRALDARLEGDTGSVAGSRIDLCEVDLQEGRLEEAAAALTALAASVAGGPDEVALRLLLGRVRLAQGRTAEAGRQAETARALAAKGDRLLDRVAADVLGARVRGASSTPSEMAAARAALEALLPVAEGLDRSLSFELRLALASLDGRAGNEARRRERLTALERDARERGFALAAGWASAAAR